MCVNVNDSKALSGLSVRFTNPEETDLAVARAAIDCVVPLLVEKGLVSPSAEARGFSLGVILKIVQRLDKSAAIPLPFRHSQVVPRQQQVVGQSVLLSGQEEPLGQWLPQLVSALVESMSALEPRVLQYMQFHTSRMQLSEEELEQARVKMAQSSPMQEALNACLLRLSACTVHLRSTSLVQDLSSCACCMY